MSMKSILVMLSGDDADLIALRQAFGVAKLFGAHVEAVLVEPDPDQVVYAADLYRSADERAESATQKRSAAQLAFVLATREADARITAEMRGHGSGVTASYRGESGQPEKLAVPLSLFADLVVLPSQGVAGRGAIFDAFSEILTVVRCPVLLSGPDVRSPADGTIALCWDDSLPATHALAAALPLLEKAGSVHVLMAQRHQNQDFDTSELLEYLALHGVNAETRIVPVHGRTSEALIAAVDELHCSLLILGAYGHNRTIETIFGGVTDDIVRSSVLPALLAH
jgi:nucleotide-binding universal stress UspA family protein